MHNAWVYGEYTWLYMVEWVCSGKVWKRCLTLCERTYAWKEWANLWDAPWGSSHYYLSPIPTVSWNSYTHSLSKDMQPMSLLSRHYPHTDACKLSINAHASMVQDCFLESLKCVVWNNAVDMVFPENTESESTESTCKLSQWIIKYDAHVHVLASIYQSTLNCEARGRNVVCK